MVRASQSTKRGKQKQGLERTSWVPDGFPAPVSCTHLCACLQEPQNAPATYCKAPFIFRLARASKSFSKPKESKLPLNERSTLHIHLNNKGHEKHKIKKFWHWHRQRFLIKSSTIKKKLLSWNSPKLKLFAPWKTLPRKQKGKPEIGRKYSQFIYLTKKLYQEYRKNSCHSVRQIIQLKMGKKSGQTLQRRRVTNGE